MSASRSAIKALAAACGLAFAGPALANPRVASLSICADQYVLALATDSEIAALSMQSRGPLSPDLARAKNLPQAKPTAEAVARSGANVVVAGPGFDIRQAALLRRFGIKVVELRWVEDWAGIQANLGQVRTGLGPVSDKSGPDPYRLSGQILLDKRVNAIRAAPGQSALYLTPSLGSAGGGTYVDAAFAAAGLSNDGVRLGLKGWQGMTPEQLLRAQPKRIVTSFFDAAPPSARAPALRNAAVAKRIKAAEIQHIPGRFWPCAGPLWVDAVEQLARSNSQ
jgi:iron complex transport system substrate-binding protein